ncbi:MAG: molybdopterin-dependent oxidoreductase [Actinomycetota bacterium]|nr:molybdopterin-dependent oxidoreductase [Actinomycetota bacterium]
MTEPTGRGTGLRERLRELNQRIEDNPPPGPFRRGFFRSPLRGPWLTSIFGFALLIGLPLMILTGLLSYAAYNPRLGANDITPARALLGFYFFDWPTSPSWLYRLNQGIHVTLGITLVPLILAKLWSVIPKLFDWPPAKSLAQVLERVTIGLLVGSVIFEFATGILNAQNYYPWKFSFYDAHLYGAWVFIGAFVSHIALKIPTMKRSLKTRSLRKELRTPLSATEPEALDPDALAPTDPVEPSLSRRGVLALVGAGSVTLFALTVGQTLGGKLRQTALLTPRGRIYGDKPNDFQINKTAAAVGIKAEQTGAGWRLQLNGPNPVALSREQLLAMPQHTEKLPIACVEGWSTVQEWTGVRLADLAALAGFRARGNLLVESLQDGGDFSRATLSHRQLTDTRSLLALKVNGADLALDHGFPARVIVPAAPGVHNTKWVRAMTFGKG